MWYDDLQLAGGTVFDDVPRDKWYTKFVEASAELGLIEGYPDNTYRPEKAITRAETVTIVNRALGRKPHRDGLPENMITWPDNMDVDAWYYADIQEAVNSHDFRMDLSNTTGTYERWTALLPVRDWAAFEQTRTDLYATRYFGSVDVALFSDGSASGESGEKREEEAED